MSILSIIASIIGMVGAKLYHASSQYRQGERSHRPLLSGACIQGFVLGAVATLAIGTRVANIPLGSALDAICPALMFGMAVGRLGCFLGGCCAGRPTSSRWGIWSSDRSVGIRRVPVQLLESAVALTLGVSALLALWVAKPTPAGVLFVGGIAAYTLARQLLLPLRDQGRQTTHGRIIVLTVCAMILVVDIAIALTGV